MNKLTPERIKEISDMKKVKPLNALTIEFDNDGDLQSINLNGEDIIKNSSIPSTDYLHLHSFIESLRVDEKEYTE